jgi:hypothetical protein
MGEDTSDGNGLGKNREPVGFERAVSKDDVVRLAVGKGAGLAPLVTEESMDNKA